MDYKRINCLKCKHYYVTWEQTFPNGCRMYNVKAKQLPSKLVLDSTKKMCEFYEIKVK